MVLIFNTSMISESDARSKIKQVPVAGKPHATSPGEGTPPDPNVGQPLPFSSKSTCLPCSSSQKDQLGIRMMATLIYLQI